MEDEEVRALAPILPFTILIAIAAAVHGELHPGTVEAGRRWQRLFAFLTVIVVVVRQALF